MQKQQRRRTPLTQRLHVVQIVVDELFFVDNGRAILASRSDDVGGAGRQVARVRGQEVMAPARFAAKCHVTNVRA